MHYMSLFLISWAKVSRTECRILQGSPLHTLLLGKYFQAIENVLQSFITTE